ncbi:MAG: hypothetical protein KTR20_02335 [Cellvibrionaceae bacterium]|nr:hypothetical protein [Cellvibrionaceae bacterium]
MKKTVRVRIERAFRKMLGAVIRLALRNGLSYPQFAALSKSLYVAIAAKDYGLQGRRTNDSRIALITGLDRREIKRIRQVLDEKIFSSERAPDKMARILTHWHESSDYTGDDGLPRELDLDGEAPSFSALIQAHGGDIAAVTVLREFKRSQVVDETPEGRLRVNKRHYIPNYHADANKSPAFVDPDAIEHGSSMLADHINTIFHNLYREDKRAPEKFELRASNATVKKSQVPAFYHYINTCGLQFLVEVDQWLTAHQVPSDSIEATERLGVGLYLIEGADSAIGDNDNE